VRRVRVEVRSDVEWIGRKQEGKWTDL
jgi:hypothetical protein